MKLKQLILILLMGISIGGIIVYFVTKSMNKEQAIEISHNLILQKVEALGNLEVVKYTIQDIIEYNKIRDWLPNAKTSLIVVGEVIGCIDLTKVSAEDIFTSGDSIRLTLPAPEICHVKIDHSKSKIHNMDYGLWEKEELADEAYRYAETQIRQEALKMDIATDSRNNAVNLLRPILESMGFKKVFITFRSENTKGNEQRYSLP